MFRGDRGGSGMVTKPRCGLDIYDTGKDSGQKESPSLGIARGVGVGVSLGATPLPSSPITDEGRATKIYCVEPIRSKTRQLRYKIMKYEQYSP